MSAGFPQFEKDAGFLLTIGSSLLIVVSLCLQFCLGASLLTMGAFGLTICSFLLTVGKCI